jgi:hypothetical protein
MWLKSMWKTVVEHVFCSHCPRRAAFWDVHDQRQPGSESTSENPTLRIAAKAWLKAMLAANHGAHMLESSAGIR